MADSNKSLKMIGMILVLAILAYGIFYFISNKSSNTRMIVDGFANASADEKKDEKKMMKESTETTEESTEESSPEDAMMEKFQNENPVQQTQQLTAAELLPNDNSSQWAQVYPTGEGSLKDRNFLQAGYHIGINTVGQTLRNANLQLRSEPPAPQVKVSPWLQSTIEPDLGRKPFEIGGCA
jgi:hypothetical protein